MRDRKASWLAPIILAMCLLAAGSYSPRCRLAPLIYTLF